MQKEPAGKTIQSSHFALTDLGGDFCCQCQNDEPQCQQTSLSRTPPCKVTVSRPHSWSEGGAGLKGGWLVLAHKSRCLPCEEKVTPVAGTTEQRRHESQFWVDIKTPGLPTSAVGGSLKRSQCDFTSAPLAVLNRFVAEVKITRIPPRAKNGLVSAAAGN